MGTRQQATIPVSESEANGESGFNDTTSITVEEPESGSLEVGSLTGLHIILNFLASCLIICTDRLGTESGITTKLETQLLANYEPGHSPSETL